MKNTDLPIIVTQDFETNVEHLWKVITELDHMKQWFFDNIEEFQAIEGFETQFTITNNDRVFPHIWKITSVEKSKHITYNWRYGGYPGDSFVRFELLGNNDRTLLQLSHTITEDFPSAIPEFSRMSCLNGWNYFIKQSLPAYIVSLSTK
ncbi:MAG TPA: SRPBCC domain-containing protein [Saprospiraceae bacterium]|nr:SRPBCC domain-containing protein [Saprospiraceae bacterium]